jgi:phage tail sheath protein FI
MARAAYLAPGVYVEEVPSAQQPIAGVGTNTVGFIGIVPDIIYCPEPNPEYDPVLAQAALRLAELKAQASQEAKPDAKARIQADIEAATRKLDQEIQNLQTVLTEQERNIPAQETARSSAQNALTEAEKALADFQPDPNDSRQDATRKRRPLVANVEKATADLGAASTKLSDLHAEIAAKREELESLRAAKEGQTPAPSPQPGAPDESALLRESILKPYILKRFTVELNPGVTVLCTNFSEYARRFGAFSADDPSSPGKALSPGHRALTHAVYGFFKNGGTRCFVARLKSDNAAEIDRALTAMESIDAIAIIAAPGLDGPTIWDKLVAHCELCEDRFGILDCPADVEANGDMDVTLLSYESANNLLPQRNKNAAFYFPHIEVIDPAKQMQDEDPARGVPLKYRGRVYVSPTGHIAGIYARTDELRGVHKAPANAAVLGALNVKYYIGKPRQELLNPQGVNCIRNMNGNINVWGARTIGGDKNAEWKYINVRRFFLFLRESIDEGTQWVVFEPNDPALWGKIRRNVSAFLTNVWRTGALFGLTPEEAFYVKCDAETNPPEVRDLGMVVTEIGVAIVRPAEFVIFRITQSTGPRTT